jgi:hypothetical protein
MWPSMWGRSFDKWSKYISCNNNNATYIYYYNKVGGGCGIGAWISYSPHQFISVSNTCLLEFKWFRRKFDNENQTQLNLVATFIWNKMQ